VFISTLQKTPASGFSTPIDYFNTLESQINAKITLAQFETETPGFAVPDGYFDKLQQNILAKTSEAKQSIKLWQRPIFKYAVAACLVLTSTAGWFAKQEIEAAKQAQSLELAKEQMLYDIDESVILEYVQESQNVKTASMTEGEMENYILDNFSTTELSNSL
jgi:hypothetical protein